MYIKRNLPIVLLLLGSIIMLSSCNEDDLVGPEGIDGKQTRYLVYGFPPPPAESWKYRQTEPDGRTLTVRYISEEVDELINGHIVYRSHILGNPPGCGEYIAYDPEVGEYKIAMVYPKNDISRREAHAGKMNIIDYPDTPIPKTLARFGASVGTTIEREEDGEVFAKISVESYETVTVPCGTYDGTMKVKMEIYEDKELFIGPLYYWFDSVIGLIKLEGYLSDAMTSRSETGRVELIDYSPPGTYIKQDSEDEFSGVIYFNPIPQRINQ